jgi:hypothetical protein
LVAQHAARPGEATRPSCEAIRMMLPPPRDHRGERRLDHEERPGEVDPDHPVPGSLLHLQHGRRAVAFTRRGPDMLPTHGRYDYSNITTRPDYSWPGGRRLAVYLALNIEAFAFGTGKGAAIAPPDQAQSHSIYSWRDYGNR